MNEKIYQIKSEKIGIINFLKPWILIHIKNDDYKIQFFSSSTKKSIKSFENYFSNEVLKNKSVNKKLELFNFIENNYNSKKLNLLIESIKEENINFKVIPIDQLKTNDVFLSLLVINVCYYFNQLLFEFNEIKIIIKVVDQFLAVDFWTKK